MLLTLCFFGLSTRLSTIGREPEIRAPPNKRLRLPLGESAFAVGAKTKRIGKCGAQQNSPTNGQKKLPVPGPNRTLADVRRGGNEGDTGSCLQCATFKTMLDSPILADSAMFFVTDVKWSKSRSDCDRGHHGQADWRIAYVFHVGANGLKRKMVRHLCADCIRQWCEAYGQHEPDSEKEATKRVQSVRTIDNLDAD